MSSYLDYNATAPVHPLVLEEMIAAYRQPGNPDSRTHFYGEQAKSAVESARDQTAHLLGVDHTEVIFNSGATEGNNMVLLGLEDYGKRTGKTHIVTSAIEHKAVLEACRHLEEHGFTVDYVHPDQNGVISADKILEKADENTLLVSLMHVNNETGVIQPVHQIGKELKKRGIYFHIDATQSVGKLISEVRNLDYDFLTFSAHKLEGPQGIGVLVVRNKCMSSGNFQPVFYGGGQEGGYRPGTVPTALAAGCGKACEIAEQEAEHSMEQARLFQKTILNELDRSGLEYSVNGDPEHLIPTTLNISIHGVNSEALMLLSRDCCAISNGSACTSKAYSTSYVLKAMGLSEERASEALRISWGSQTCYDSALKDVQGLIEIAKTLA